VIEELMTAIFYIAQILLLVLLSLAAVGMLFMFFKIYRLLDNMQILFKKMESEIPKKE